MEYKTNNIQDYDKTNPLTGTKLFLDLALRSAGMGLFSYDSNTQNIVLDELSYKVLDIDLQNENLSDEFIKRIHPADLAELKTLLFLSLKKTKDFEAEYRIFRRDGSLHYIVSRARIISAPDSPPKLEGLIWDITDQKNLEMNLHENLRKMNSIINNLEGVVFRCKLDDEMTMEYISHGVEKLTGYPAWHFMNKMVSYRSLIYNDDKEKVLNEINNALTTGCQYQIEYRIRSDSGKLRWLKECGRGVSEDAIEGIITDITENKYMETRLNRSLKQFQQLNHYLQKVREQERISISRELHDDLGQSLTAVKLDLASLSRSLPDNDNARLQIKNIASLVSSTIKSVQNITAQLRPQIIDDLGLSSAIEWYASDFISRTGISVKLDIPSEINLKPQISLAIYRIMQESLTNIARHSKATLSEITLSVLKGVIVLSISDNGTGISNKANASKKSFGLISMKERAKSIGGKLEISTLESGGTRILLTLPIKEKKSK